MNEKIEITRDMFGNKVADLLLKMKSERDEADYLFFNMAVYGLIAQIIFGNKKTVSIDFETYMDIITKTVSERIDDSMKGMFILVKATEIWDSLVDEERTEAKA